MGKFEHIALDSNCYTYLIQALGGIEKPNDSLAIEKISLVRLFLYLPRKFSLSISNTVKLEYKNIKDEEKRNNHFSWESLISDIINHNPINIEARAKEFCKLHRAGWNDCKILAECESENTKILLSYDSDFIKNLNEASEVTAIVRPSAYWAGLEIEKGTKPTWHPAVDNPLSALDWWKW